MTLHISAESAMALALALDNPTYALEAKRRAAADMVEDLIAFLDDTDGDCDLEAAGDELDCSWAEQFAGRATPGGICEDDEDGADTEPSLGAPEARMMPVDHFYAQRTMIVQSGAMGSQASWAAGSTSDGENNVEDEGEATNEDGGDVNEEPHDAIDEGNDEPSLCFQGGLCAHDGPADGSYMGYEAKQAIDDDVRAMLAKVKRKPKEEPSLTIVGPDLRAYRIRIAN